MTDQLVCVLTCSNRQDAELARGALEASGIDATVAADDAGGGIPGLDLVRGVGLWIREEDRGAAEEVLKIDSPGPAQGQP